MDLTEYSRQRENAKKLRDERRYLLAKRRVLKGNSLSSEQKIDKLVEAGKLSRDSVSSLARPPKSDVEVVNEWESKRREKSLLRRFFPKPGSRTHATIQELGGWWSRTVGKTRATKAIASMLGLDPLLRLRRRLNLNQAYLGESYGVRRQALGEMRDLISHSQQALISAAAMRGKGELPSGESQPVLTSLAERSRALELELMRRKGLKGKLAAHFSNRVDFSFGERVEKSFGPSKEEAKKLGVWERREYARQWDAYFKHHTRIYEAFMQRLRKTLGHRDFNAVVSPQAVEGWEFEKGVLRKTPVSASQLRFAAENAISEEQRLAGGIEQEGEADLQKKWEAKLKPLLKLARAKRLTLESLSAATEDQLLKKEIEKMASQTTKVGRVLKALAPPPGKKREKFFADFSKQFIAAHSSWLNKRIDEEVRKAKAEKREEDAAARENLVEEAGDNSSNDATYGLIARHGDVQVEFEGMKGTVSALLKKIRLPKAGPDREAKIAELRKAAEKARKGEDAKKVLVTASSGGGSDAYDGAV